MNSKQKKYFTTMLSISMILTGIVFVICSNNFKYYDITNYYNDIMMDDEADSSLPEVISTELTFEGTGNNNIIRNNQQGQFYYDRLEENLKKSYEEIYTGLKKHQNKITLSKKISNSELEKIMYIILFDCPELFHIQQTYSFENNNSTILYPEYSMSISEYLKNKEAINEIAKNIINMVEGKTEYEKSIAIHDFILKNTYYKENIENCDNIYGTLINNAANCKGYSVTYTYLLRKAGIVSAEVLGEVNTEVGPIAHTWCLVKIDGEYYYTDICWDDIDETPDIEGISNHYAFFNMTYDEMLQERTLKKQEMLGYIPQANSTTNNFYKKNNLYAQDKSEVELIINNNLAKYIINNMGPLVIQCANQEVLQEATDNISQILSKKIQDGQLPVNTCKYSVIKSGNLIIIHGFDYIKENNN